MKCLILAAGYSTRLYPLTENTAKQFLKIGNKYMVEHILDSIKHIEDIDEVIIISNNKFYKDFENWLENFKVSNNRFNKPIKLINNGTNSNEERLGAVGDMHFAISSQNIDEEVLIIGGDNLFETDLKNMIEIFKKNQAPVVAARDLGDPNKLANKFGTIEVDENNKIIDFEEKPAQPKSSLAATCIYLYTKEDIEELEKCIKENKKPDNTGDFLNHLVNKKTVYCYHFNEPWYDIGSHEELKEVQEKYS
ncbi:nucleotidyltransferase family protein [Candidatus Woesearchaeota archaeon]|jgi:glucose-1-phosphate thymidylyltransferase|nr:nucleotidyltransferase family protein [Candidatus Woesearchaeota archaeon]